MSISRPSEQGLPCRSTQGQIPCSPALQASQLFRRFVELESDHIESMRRITAKLVDEAVFPIEIGLHRLGVEVGTLIGPPIAVRGIGLRQYQRRTDFKLAVITAVEHEHFPVHLRE